MAFVLVVSLYTTRVVLNVLGASDYGIFNVVCGFVSMFGFLNTSMTNAIQRFYNYEIGKNGGAQLNNLFNCALIVQVVLAILVVLVVESFGLWYLNNELVIPADRLWAANVLFQFSVIQLFFIIVSVPYSAIIIAYERMDYYALVSIVDVFIKLGIVLILPYVGYDKLLFYGLLLTIVGFANFLFYLVYARKNFSQIRITRITDKSAFKSILSFSGWNVFGTFAYLLKNQGLAVVLNVVFGTVINAAYGISNQVMNAIKQFSMNMIIAFKPQLVQSYASGQHTKTRTLMYAMTKISYIMLFAISLPVIIQADYILTLWLENVPEYTINLTRLAIVSMLLSNFNTPLVQVVHAVGKQKLFQIVTSCIIVGIVPCSYIILKLDATPDNIYWVTILFVLINQVACLYTLRKVFNFSYSEYITKAIIPCLLVTLLSPILPLCLELIDFQLPFVKFLVVSSLSVLSVVIASYVLALNKTERKYVNDFFQNLKNKRLKK